MFFWQSQSNLKKEKQKKIRKEKAKEKQGRQYGPAHYRLYIAEKGRKTKLTIARCVNFFGLGAVQKMETFILPNARD